MFKKIGFGLENVVLVLVLKKLDGLGLVT